MVDTRTIPIPTELKLKKKSRTLEVTFSDGAAFVLPAEYLRVHSPSAEVTLHSPGEGLLVTGKEEVGIARIEPVGRYAIKLVFDDGHDTGLYSWQTLYELGMQFESKWRRYLERLDKAGHRRSSGSPRNDS